jgi:murein DD-endopeptidase MepM/ murein hydrolase activator NlpD
MTPSSLLVTAAAGLAGAALLVVPGVAHPPPPRAALRAAFRSSAGMGAAVRPPARVSAAARGAAVVEPAPLVRPGAPAAAFRWPLSPAPEVLRRFAVGPQPWSPGHRGVDLAAGAGQHVLSAGAGTIAFAGLVAGRGVVTVAHAGGLRTTYEPVTSGIGVGRAVAAGDELGVLAEGNHCPVTCLHWGALRGDVYVDPLTLLRPPVPPILLPLATGR